ncbi:MAG: HutP family protein [Deltaproteobacteria bacterium]|jgi:hut operon positive regulator|nr:HutP family protein [Deltaproteobacteria bacterium]
MISIDSTTRIGKIAMLLSMSNDEEERYIKEVAAKYGFRVALTYIAGEAQKLNATYSKSVINAAVAGGVIKKMPNQVHSVLHASLEAFQSMMPKTSVSNNILTKVAIVADSHWLAVTTYGDSAFSALTNHERAGMGIMHL